MLNFTLCAITRVICVLLEMNQTETGIAVPDALKYDLTCAYFLLISYFLILSSDFLLLSGCTCQRNTRKRFLLLLQPPLMRQKLKRPRKEGRRKNSLETVGGKKHQKHCNGILLGSTPHHRIMRQHRLTYLWQPLLTSKICLAQHFFKTIFYTLFSY